MEHIFVTFRLKDAVAYDLKIPIHITVKELLNIIGIALSIKIDENASLHVEPLGRILGREEVIAEEKIYNGALITLV